jgi:TonB family protein
MNGSQLIHRSPVAYPADALVKGVEGTVVVQVKLDASGEVSDASVLSGPDALRRSALQSVLSWHFDKSEALTTRLVNIDFVKPPVPAAGEIAGVIAAIPSAAPPTPRVPSGGGGRSMQPLAPIVPNNTIGGIEFTGVSDAAKAQLLEHLQVHAGDTFSQETIPTTVQVVRQFDEHLMVNIGLSPTGARIVRITAPETPLPAPAMLATGNGLSPVRIGANVQQANLLSSVKPIYPPLAKQARVQGVVKFDATIAKDGTMEDLKVVSGPPLLIAAALQAVKQWVYKPTLLNGQPVEVATSIDISFTLSDTPPDPAAVVSPAQ